MPDDCECRQWTARAGQCCTMFSGSPGNPSKGTYMAKICYTTGVRRYFWDVGGGAQGSRYAERFRYIVRITCMYVLYTVHHTEAAEFNYFFYCGGP